MKPISTAQKEQPFLKTLDRKKLEFSGKLQMKNLRILTAICVTVVWSILMMLWNAPRLHDTNGIDRRAALLVNDVRYAIDQVNRSNRTNSKSAPKPKICILIPAISIHPVWESVDQSDLVQGPLNSLEESIEPKMFSYVVYIIYRIKDVFFDNKTTLSALQDWARRNLRLVSIKVEKYPEETTNLSMMLNFLSQVAIKDECEYLYRINADTNFLTSWTSSFVEVLDLFHPPMKGVVGPTCNLWNMSNFAPDFVHINHFHFFKDHYPPDITALNNWIFSVYGDSNSRRLDKVKVGHINPASGNQGGNVGGLLGIGPGDGESHNQKKHHKPQRQIAKVIAYSLFGNNPRYTDGVYANTQLITQFFPDWTMRVYHDMSVPEAVIHFLHSQNVELVNMSFEPIKSQMVWRFLPAEESNLERFMSRDIDSRLSARERDAVRDWELSNLSFHVLRDHPSHNKVAVSGGLWGCKGGAVRDMRQRLLQSKLDNNYLVDMNFLNGQIWPLMNEAGVLIHDSFSCDRENTRPFPSPRDGLEHVGSVHIDGRVPEVDEDMLWQAVFSGMPHCEEA